MLPLLIFIVLPHFSTSGIIGKLLTFADKPNCGLNEVFKTCGPKCPPTCDTLKDTVCCEVKCVAGCFCADGYMLETKNGSKKCLPIAECPGPGILQFRQKGVDFLEGDAFARIPVIRTNGSLGKVTVRWRSVGPLPYQGRSGILTFPDGVVTQFIEIPIEDNQRRNPEVTFRVELFDPSNKAEIADLFDKILVTIIDDDMKPGYPEMEKADIVVSENVGTVKINVLRMEGADGQIRVKYKTVPGTANDFTDFTPTSGELVFEEGEALKSIFVNIVDDKARERPETFFVQLFDARAGPRVRNFKPLGTRMTTTVTIKDDDMNPGYPELESASLVVPETVGTVQIKVLRKQGTDGQIKIKYRTVEGTATANIDFKPVQGELVFEDGENLKIVQVEIIDDGVWEKAEKFRFELYDPSAGPDVVNFKPQGSILSTEITILDNDMQPGLLEFDKSLYEVSENVGTVKVAVVRVGGSDGTIRVLYKTVPKTAQDGLDFQPANGMLTFKEGETIKFISIRITNDNIKEPVEFFEVILYDATADPDVINFLGIGTRMLTTVKIIDDDMKPGYLELEKSNYVVPENVGTVRVAVVRVGGSDGEVRVLYETVSKTALAGQDFQPKTGQLVFKDGESLKYILIEIINDNIREPTEVFEVVIYNATDASDVINFRGLGVKTTATITITDDDMRPGRLELEKAVYVISENAGVVKVGVVRVGGSDGEIRVLYKTVPKTAQAGQDFELTSGELIFKDGETLQFISVRITNDKVKEPTEIFEVVLYDPTASPDVINFRGLGTLTTTVVKIIDDDNRPGVLEMEKTSIAVPEDVGVAQVTIVRTGGEDGKLLVKYSTVDGTAQAGSDYIFTSGEIDFENGQIRQTLTIPILDDNEKEPMENFQVQIVTDENPASKKLTTVTIIDNDETPGIFEFRETSIIVQEGDRKVRLTVVRRGGTDGSVTLSWRTIDVTAREGFDYNGRQGSITFNEGDTEKSFLIEIIDDQTKEDSEQFIVGIFDPTHGVLGQNSMITVTILDNDNSNPPIPVKSSNIQTFFTNPIVRVDRGSTIARFHVRRSGDLRPIRFFLETRDGTAKAGVDYRRTRGEIEFDENEIELTIEIKLIENRNSEGTKFFLVKLSNPSLGIVIPGKDVLAILIDNDASNIGDIKYRDLGLETSGTKTGTSGSFTEISDGKGSFTESISGSKTSGTSVDFTGTSGVSGEFIKTSSINGGFTGTSGSIKTSGISGSFTGTSGLTRGFIGTSGTSGTSGGFSGSITGTSGVDGNFEGRTGIGSKIGVSALNSGHSQVVQTAQVQQRELKGFETTKIECPEGMTYRDCAPTCPKSCATLNKGPSCDKKCINACFCPDDLVIENLETLRCIPPSQCRAQAALIPQGDSGIGGLLGGLGGLGGIGGALGGIGGLGGLLSG